MIRLFKHYIPYAVLLLGIADFALLLVAAEAGWRIKLWQIDSAAEPIWTRLPQLLSFAVALECALIAVGAYGDEALQSLRFAAARLLVAVSLGVILISLMFFLFPELTLWRSNSAYAMALSIGLLILVRAVFGRLLGGESFKRRVLVLGAGARAARLRALADTPGAGFMVVGYVAMNPGPQRVPEAIDRHGIESLGDHVVTLGASEVVLALDERRNALPLKDLLRIKTTGVHVNEISTFLERETGRVDLDSVNPSWLIFSDGFSSGRRLSSIAKRAFDLAASSLLLLVAAPVIALTAVLVKLESRGPAFFRQQRVGLYGEPFWIPKLRSMRQDAEAPGTAIWAEKDDPRITRVGRVIRKVRIDELPQVWSVLKGEMSFVGPRPERPQFVAELEQDLNFYAERHMVKPGITGWAQINYPYGASLEDARHKLEYDLYYAKNYTPFLDVLILLQTVRVLLWPDGGALMLFDWIGVWSHAAAAILFAALAIWQLRHGQSKPQRRVLAAAFAATAGWALLVTLRGPHDPAALLAEGARNLAWLGFMLALLRHGEGSRRGDAAERGPAQRAVLVLYFIVMAVIVVRAAADITVGGLADDMAWRDAYFEAAMLLRITIAIAALLLVHNFYTAAAPQARWGIRLPVIALAAMWCFDLNLYTIAYLGRIWPTDLLALRGVLLVMLAPVFALATRRSARSAMRLSRSATFQSLSLLAIGLYLAAMVLIVRVVQAGGGDYSQVAAITIVFGMSLGALLFIPSRRLQAGLRVRLTKHLFRHRYDYRVEWLRFTDTLGRPGDDDTPLDCRMVKAIADITESPGGLLLLPQDDGHLAAAARWNWATLDAPAVAADAALAHWLEGQGRILSFDEARAGTDADSAPVPGWILAEPSAWAAVPLVHVDRLVGVVLLARPWPDRTLDWEDFDLLRAAGRQVASYLAEARGQEALSDARRFDEFNRRFAFILHDVKNLVSQLSLLTRNAERHADNPAFRADMIETLRSSTARMNDLLARLSQHEPARAVEPHPVALGPVVDAIAAARRGAHPIEVAGRRDIVAAADTTRLAQALGHLVQNAIDASPPGEPVWLRLGSRGLDATIEILDRGHGMSADFVRASLFRPFASTKSGGFGIGAFEARTIVAAMGGRLEVESREGEGSRFTIVLPLADAAAARRRMNGPTP